MAEKTEKTVEELVRMIERCELGLPEMQRPYVWRSTRVRDLLDSLYRGYPSGTILLWESDKKVAQRKIAVEQEAGPVTNNHLLLLDGQQRLTSLAAVIRGKLVNVRGRKRPIDLLFNLEHPDKLDFFTEVHEEGPDDSNENERAEDEVDSSEDELQKRVNRRTFVVATKKLARLPQWVKVSDFFKSDSDTVFLKQAGVRGYDDPNHDRYQKRLAALRKIREYSYRIDVLERKLSYEEVTDIYVRVNSLGTKLRSSDLALAQITAKWSGSLEKFEEFQNELKRDGFNLDLGSVILRNLVTFATGQSRFQTIGSLNLEALQESWEKSCRGMQYALNFMRNNVGVESPALLASPLVLLTVSYFGYKNNYSFSPNESEELRRWVLLANAKGRYSRGSSETLLDQDLRILREGKSAKELMERLQQQVGSLRVTPDELKGRNQNSALFKTMFLAFRASGAKDWRSNLAISINNKGKQDKLQFHHIFPRAVLKDRLQGSYTARDAARLADDIANLCFISGKTNRQLGKEMPRDYISRHIQEAGSSMFEAQCIPTEQRFLGLGQYKDFLAERRRRLAIRLNEFLHGPDGSDA